MPDTIHSQRLLLRPYRPDDASAVADQIGAFAVSQWLTTVPHPYSEADARAFFDLVAGKPLVRAVEKDGAVIGCVSIDSELGYWFGADHWGQGYATEAAGALIERYFASFDDPICSRYFDGNASSWGVMRKLGFVPDGTTQSHSIARGQDVLSHRTILTKTAWKAAA